MTKEDGVFETEGWVQKTRPSLCVPLPKNSHKLSDLYRVTPLATVLRLDQVKSSKCFAADICQKHTDKFPDCSSAAHAENSANGPHNVINSKMLTFAPLKSLG